MRKLSWWLLCVFCLLISTAPLFAQANSGDLTGTVFDTSGAAIPNATVVALDERGEAWSTARLAGRLRDWNNSGQPVAFVIGSADGLADAIQRDADVIMALSALTLPHGLARIMLAEQIYRAASLLRGHPYHRE